MLNPGEIFLPPRLAKHHGFIVTSASLTGSQKPIATPMRGSGEPQAQIGRSGLSVSGRSDGKIFSPPTERGKRQDQHTSVTGFTNLPVHFPGVPSMPAALAIAGAAIATPAAASVMNAADRSRRRPDPSAEIGRAACRERGGQYV